MSPTALLLPKVKPSDRHWYAYDVEFDGVVIVSIDWAWLQGFCKAPPGGRKRFLIARPFDRWGELRHAKQQQ
jgi:hypothetical protein